MRRRRLPKNRARVRQLLRALRRGCWLPDARDLAQWMLCRALRHRERYPV